LFKISARTVLELGAELISSDVIAFYELIKNAFDAKSPSGAEIRFEIVLRRNHYLKFRSRLSEPSPEVARIYADIEAALEPKAPAEALERFKEELGGAKRQMDFIEALDRAYGRGNRIIVSDEGTGMSQKDLLDNYLVIGTPSRKRAIDAALAATDERTARPPYLGEKGIGRLSAMRLGNTLTVETAQQADKRMNLLKIDWNLFGDLDAMLDEIPISPERGGSKPGEDWSGTRLVIGAVAADWTHDRVQHLCEHDFARLTDPFTDAKRRPRIAMFWNGDRVSVAHMDRRLLDHAHASVKGRFRYAGGSPVLECRFEAINLGFEHPHEVEDRTFTVPDLEGAISGTSGDVPMTALQDLGAFQFEAYWFNRQRLTRIDSIGDQKVVRDLQKRWSGILLFRDGFRVLPYGEDEDDWLAMDRRALASTGYLLNKTQFVGRVAISRLGNPQLIDQTNREGLRVCPEQQAFISLLQLALQSQLREFLKDVERRHKNQPIDMKDARTEVETLERRAKAAFTQIKRVVPESSPLLIELQRTFAEIKAFFERAEQRVTEIENENRQMLQMAGVGLLVEVVAHELARATENALGALEALRGKALPQQTATLLDSLRSEMTSVSKRVRVLDPLSVSGRQRKEVFNLGGLIEDVLSGHEAQFKRHQITLKLKLPEAPIRVRVVKGMMVQIIENLLSNSVYWLELRKDHERDFEPRITITLGADPLRMTYEDNGRGIAVENKEKVFRAFFSLKEKSKRRGLGLYIARDCAEYHGGELFLDDRVSKDTGRLHRFVLQFPDEVVVP